MSNHLTWWRLLVLTSGLLPVAAMSQPATSAAVPAAFVPLLKQLGRSHTDRQGNPLLWSDLPVLVRDSTYGPNQRRRLNFELRLADQPPSLQHRVVRLTGHGYPVCYSVVFANCLVALFKDGKFSCYQLPDLQPNEQLARQLNVKGWARCWLLDGRLVAQHGNSYYACDAATHAWQPYQQPVPFGQRPKLYEDARYLAYADCHGEFGGVISFYNKQTGQAHLLSATCANSVWQESGQYRVLSSLGHMMGSAGCEALADPEQLPLAAKASKSTWLRAPAPAPQAVTNVFAFYNLQLFGGFRWQNQTLYLMHWWRTTFLVAIDGRRITVVDPLFADDLYTFNPITTTYDAGLALTSLNSNNLPETSEVAALLWQGQQVAKVEWGKPPTTSR